MMLKPMRAKDGQKTIADEPDLLAAFSPRNGDLLPEEVGYRAKRLVWWRCSVVSTHEWQAAPAAMKGCPFCADPRTDSPHPESAAMPKAARPVSAPTDRPPQSAPVSRPADPPSRPPPSSPAGLRALPIDLDLLEDAFCDGALCFLSPLTGEVFLPRKWREDCPGYVRVPYADRRKWIPDFIAAYVVDPRRQASLREAASSNEFLPHLDEKEEVQWAAYTAARCGMELRAWLEGLGIRVIPRRSGRTR
jgi:hypothetical protein